jgi:antitoxin component of MazEF toxin-antitoxin module
MKTTLIKVGNSRGVRIPKSFIEEVNLGDNIDLTIDDGKIIISTTKPEPNEEALISEMSLSDWLRPEEDEAWQHIQ